MFILKATLVCLIACFVCVSCRWRHGGGFFEPPKVVNASSIWIGAPVDGSNPTIGVVTANTTGEGKTLKDFCDYTISNNAFPWELANITAFVNAVNDDDSGYRPGYERPRIVSLDMALRFCNFLVQNDYTFIAPPHRFGHHGGNRYFKRGTNEEEKKPGF